MNQKLNLTYQKGSKEIPLNKPHIDESTVEMQKDSSIDALQLSGYTKEDGVLSQGIICVISGGTTREKAFLNELYKKKTFLALEVIFISTKEGEGGLTPKMMANKYQSLKEEGAIKIGERRISLETIDNVYTFTDVDHYEAELRAILSEGKNCNTPIWIISNPDFEIWLYYCYYSNPEEDLKEVIDAQPSKRSSLLKNVNGRFNNGGGIDPRKAFERLQDGVVNSLAHYDIDDAGMPQLLSTQMHIFAQEVLDKLGHEYENWIETRKAWRLRKKK